jgi:Ribose/xylose/arabinose/galactoside ABC-type transport systems, permease components
MKKLDGNQVLMGLLKGRTFFVLVVLLLFFSMKSPAFFTVSSLVTVTKHVALYGILAIGMTFVIITGGIDLSVGSVVGLVGMIAGGLVFEGLTLEMIGYRIYFSAPAVMLIGLLLGMLVGFVNGVVITRFGVAPFIATFGTMYIARGFAMLRSNGATYQNLNGQAALGNTGFSIIGGSLFGFPIVVIVFVVLALIAILVLRFTPLGWHIFSVGGNPVASALSGVKVKRVSTYVYIFFGFCAAVVGLITTAQLTAANPSSGDGWEMNAISAVVLGGTSMSGGVGSIGGTIIGAFVIGVISDGMIMIGVSEFWQRVIKGVIIIAAVMIDQFQARLQAKMALMRAAEAK